MNRYTKDKRDGNHGKRGMVSGNARYTRARLEKLLAGGKVGDAYGNAKKNVTMGKN